MWSKALIMTWDDIFFKGMASLNLVEAHIIVNRLLPDFVFGIRPTQSIITLVNGSSNAGTGFNGAGLIWSDLVYQPFDTHDKFSQTLPHFF